MLSPELQALIAGREALHAGQLLHAVVRSGLGVGVGEGEGGSWCGCRKVVSTATKSSRQ